MRPTHVTPTTTTLNTESNSMIFTTNNTHNCYPTATNVSSNLNSMTLTNHETHNRHPTAMPTMNNALYSPNPLSTPTSDCEAQP